jgi:hypothetical protein
MRPPSAVNTALRGVIIVHPPCSTALVAIQLASECIQCTFHLLAFKSNVRDVPDLIAECCNVAATTSRCKGCHSEMPQTCR